MTNEERQQVIDALETGKALANGEGTHAYDDAFNAALAIMRRPEEIAVPHVHEWFSTGAMKPGQIRCISCGTWGRER